MCGWIEYLLTSYVAKTISSASEIMCYISCTENLRATETGLKLLTKASEKPAAITLAIRQILYRRKGKKC